MLAATGIKQGAAIWATVIACHIAIDAHFISASAAEHRNLIPFSLRPDLDRMASQGLVTFLAGVVDAAALHLDGDHIESGPVVSAAGLRIQIHPANFRTRKLHR